MVLHIMCARIGIGFLALRSWRDIQSLWVTIIHASWKVGTIQIKMFDGMIRELKEVRYVPQLKRNLISVGALETLDLVVSIKERSPQDDQRLDGGIEGHLPEQSLLLEG